MRQPIEEFPPLGTRKKVTSMAWRIVFICVLFIQIGTAQSVDSSRGHYPLQVGNLWQYYTWDYLNGKIFYQYGWTQRVIRDTLMPDGKTYAVLQSDLPNANAGYWRQDGPLVQSYSPVYDQSHPLFDFSKCYGDTFFVYPQPIGNANLIGVITFNDYISVFGKSKLAWDFHRHSTKNSSYLTERVVDGFGIVEEKGEAGDEWFLRGAIINGVTYGTVTSVEDEPSLNLPKTFMLLSNFPNPFNSSTTISFQIPFRQHVFLAMYDVLGREITSLLNTDLPSGVHRVIWNGKNDQGSDQPSGVYFIRLDCEMGSEQMKILMLK